jgi:hypothetical protein
MFVIVPIESNFTAGSVLKYNGTSQKWALATTDAKPVGILDEVTGDSDTGWFGRVIFAGVAFAVASRDIPNEGGWLEVENGQVYVNSASTDQCGIIAPLPQGQSARVAGDLVMIHLR